jgi:energy-coupling factor transporter transmembrane protein EcfT
MKKNYQVSFWLILFILIISLLISVIATIPIYFKSFFMFFCLTLIIVFVSVINSHVIIDIDTIHIIGSIFYNKTIKFEDIQNIYLSSPDVIIERDNPVYSNNIIGINYKSKSILKTAYISIKDTQDFINYINTQLDNL